MDGIMVLTLKLSEILTLVNVLVFHSEFIFILMHKMLRMELMKAVI